MTDPIHRKIEQLREQHAASVDSFARHPDAENRLNQIVQSALRGKAGDRFMDYLRSISTNVVLPPTATDAELRMMEGMRRLTGIIDARRRAQLKEKPDD